MSPNASLTGPPVTTEKDWRLAAPEIERAVTIAARHMLSDRAGLLEALEKSEIDSPDVRATLESTSNLLRQLQIKADSMACLVERHRQGPICAMTAYR